MINSTLRSKDQEHHHHHHHHHHEDGADKFRRQMKNEKHRWELMGKITLYTLTTLVVLVFAFLIWSTFND